MYLKSCIYSQGAADQPVLDIDVIVFHNVKYAIIQHKKHIHVWRQERKKQWIKIFKHEIEDVSLF